MQRIFPLLMGATLLALVINPAHGQTPVCYKTSNTAPGCQVVTPSTPLPVTSSGGGGGAVTIADGANVAQGTTTDAPATLPATGSAATTIALLKALANTANTPPLPTGGATSALQTTGNTSLSTISTNQTNGTQRTIVVPSATAAVGITPVVTGAAANNVVLKATPGNVYSAAATNLTTTAGFLVLLNVTASPADGAITPLACAQLPSSGSASITYGGIPAVFSTGIVAVVTSAASCFTKTTGTLTAHISGQVQ